MVFLIMKFSPPKKKKKATEKKGLSNFDINYPFQHILSFSIFGRTSHVDP